MRTTPAFRVPSSLIVLGIAFLIGACADPHPPTESSSEALAESPASSSSTALAEQACSPGVTRECKKFWYDIEGRVHCKLEHQVCRADGYAWEPCGDLDAGEAPDAGDEVDAGLAD